MIAVITDLHIGQKNFNKMIFNTQMEFFEKQFFPYLKKHKIKNVISLGDIVHNRNTIDLVILQQFKQRFFKWFEKNNVNLHLIIGNHDLQYRSTLDYNFYRETIQEFKNCIVYEEDTKVQIGKYLIGMIPWVIDTKNWKPLPGCDIICGHFEMKDFPMMKNIMSHDGYAPELFKDYKLVLSGHYHIRSNTNNIHYVGTQYQLSWNDFNEPKGFALIKDNFELEYIPNEISPKFVKIYYNSKREIPLNALGVYPTITSISKEESILISKENYVRVYVEECSDQQEFDMWYNSLLSVSKNDYKIEVIDMKEVIEGYDSEVFEENLSKEDTTIEIILNCIEGMTFDSSINKDTLLSMSKQLYKEAYDEAFVIGDEE